MIIKKKFFYGIAALIFGITGLISILILKALPYSSGIMEKVLIKELSRSPSPDFNLGSVEWEVNSYRNNTKLESFRKYFEENCYGKTGIAAASCISAEFAKRIPWGAPGEEFFNSKYDPIESFSKHIKGKPGHCITRAGYLAAILLSAGIPARVVQLMPYDDHGHTIVEIWDEEYGWVMFDPSFDGLVGDEKGPTSALAAWSSPDSIRWIGQGRSGISPAGYVGDVYENTNIFKGCLIYPEPWLYLRTEKKYSYFPFSGKFIVTGLKEYSFVFGLTLLRGIIIVCSICTILCLIGVFCKLKH